VNARSQRLCVWIGGPVFMGLFLVGFLIAGFIPPPSPTASAQTIAHMFVTRQHRIQLGLVFMTAGAPLQFVWAAAIAVQMKRIEGRYSPLTYVQLTSGAGGALLFLVPTLVLQAAAYRPESRPVEITLMLDDLGWIMFVGATTFAFVQGVALAIAVLQDRSAEPVFPRWAGYFNIWVAILFQPALFLVFFKTGPLAWRGLFDWWLPLTVFGIWFAVMVVLLLRGIAQQEREEGAPPVADLPSEPPPAQRLQTV